MTKVIVDCRLISGTAGGVESGVVSLAQGMRDLDREGLEIQWWLWQEHTDWLTPHLGSRDELLLTPFADRATDTIIRSTATRLRKSTAGAQALSLLRRVGPRRYRLPLSDGRAEAAGASLVHFPLQRAFLTDLPTVYQPHDVQHEHYPENFTAEDLYLRGLTFRAFMQAARRVVVGTTWTARDVADKVGIDLGRIDVVPLAAPRLPEPQLPREDVTRRVANGFLFYPAAPWKHKNHEGLFRAMAILRTRGYELPLVLPGANAGSSATLLEAARRSGVEDLLVLPGYVSSAEISWYYRSATMLVMPSFFESESLPIWEAFTAGTPVAASAVTAIPDQVGDAAVLFDPSDPTDMADAMMRLIDDGGLRSALVTRAAARVASFTPELTARGMLATYRQALGIPATANDREWASSRPFI